MADAEFVQYLDITDVEKYCKSSSAEERRNVICDKMQSSLCYFRRVSYFFDFVLRDFKPIGNSSSCFSSINFIRAI